MNATSRPNPFRGSLVALPTPFRDGRVDFDALRRLVDLQVAGGTDGLVAAGSTGEGASLARDERSAVIAFTAGAAAGRVPVLAGVGAAATSTAVELALDAQLAGADGLLATTPIYTRPPQRGIVAHFLALAEATPLPLVLYDIPQRTGVRLLPATVDEVAERAPTVCAVKESAGVPEVKALVEHGTVDVLCGEDSWIVEGMQAGAVGAISVVGNLVPNLVAQLIASLQGEERCAPALVEELAPLVRVLSLETNPAPLKAALAWLDLATPEVRLPLVELEPAHRAELEAALAGCVWLERR